MYLMISLFTSIGHKMCSKACATRQDFSIESTASALMSGDLLAIEAIYKFYIRITQTIMYRIQSSPKTVINLGT